MCKRLWFLSVPLMGTASLLAQNGGANNMDGDQMGGYGHMFFSGGGLLMWILFLVLVSVLVYFIVKASQGRGPGAMSRETPLDILKRRYAQGEITKQQFEEMKRDLWDRV
jgi:putative membrane protein